ncbi:MAG: hypothetical protein JW725_04920 [Candidatus Babeliaceae bacterium]|nr:hypothetical protein [Candidatus Babeliaceae bacterium]
MPRYSDFNIHGDNIVECERTFDLIKAALAEQLESIAGPNGSPVCPEFQFCLRNTNKSLHFTFFPGFGRWNEDILQFVRERGGILREAADVIITGVTSKYEEPLIAIEYCSALPAGNQAWQRNGRAYSFGLARIPYLYVAELGGYELAANRIRKASRMPNPAVPFSYLAYSLEQNTPVFPIFVTSLGAGEATRIAHTDEFADNELIALTRAIILDEDPKRIYEILRRKVLSLIRKRAVESRSNQTLTDQQWGNVYSNIKQGRSFVDFLVENAPLVWAKKTSITSLTETAKTLMELTSKNAIGLTSNVLPMCIVPRDKRPDYALRVSALYGDLPVNFVEWLARKEHLVICWVLGFKPRGDDARPDRGLPPFTRMLIGRKSDLLSVVYGPAPIVTWALLQNEPTKLIQKNGLWEAILAVSDALLVDSATNKKTNHGFLRLHWETAIQTPTKRTILTKPFPTRVGENDVDTVLHTLLSRHAGPEIYEGMCNPPGGDWSGVSLQPPDRSLELRWLTLPRVSGADTKRPDHVFQLFGITLRPIILSVESKETANAVENSIGPRLSAYIGNLIMSPASIERKNSSQPWRHSTHRLNPDHFIFASAVAFISGTESQIASVITEAKVDIVLAYVFELNGKSCEIRFIANSNTGSIISKYASHLNLSGTGISIRLG